MVQSSVFLPACANWSLGTSPCGNEGRQTCGNCKLVVYCGAECQKIDWPEHKKHCRSPLGKENWRPAWDRECRIPPWASGAQSLNWHNTFGGGKYLWGNTPAVDVLKLEQNEGIAYGNDISLLFAASGDMRHVVRTIADLPDGTKQQINVTMNDREFNVVARNTILLLLALTATDAETLHIPSCTIAETLVHVWYSASIPSDVLSLLQNRVKPLISDVCSKIANRPRNATLGKTWEFSDGRSLRLILKQKDWFRLGNFLDIPDDMTLEDTTQIRRAVTLAPERSDYRDRWYFKDAFPFMRIAKQRFQEDGLLIPFGHPRTRFNRPNPTLFHASKNWHLDDKADPSNGWPALDIQKMPWPASQDWYGKLFIYLHNTMKRFLNRLWKIRTSFILYNVDAEELPHHLEHSKYSRIEVANICDSCYIGIRGALSLLSLLLQSPQQNPHATFITLFINAVKETVKRGDPRDETPNYPVLAKYLPLPTTLWLNDADMLRIWDARDLALDTDKFFKRYMSTHDFEGISKELRVEMKKSNTIVEKWPTRLKLQAGQEGAEEEFRLELGSSFTNTERYVEWRRYHGKTHYIRLNSYP